MPPIGLPTALRVPANEADNNPGTNIHRPDGRNNVSVPRQRTAGYEVYGMALDLQQADVLRDGHAGRLNTLT